MLYTCYQNKNKKSASVILVTRLIGHPILVTRISLARLTAIIVTRIKTNVERLKNVEY